MRPVGILGGMGPEATVLLMRRVLAAVPARDDADHVPLIVDQNPQVPSRIARLIEGTGADPAPMLVAMARRLEGAGAAALAMPCNTAHHYADDIRAAVAIPFLDMVAASARVAAQAAGQGGRVGLLASPAVAQVGLFDRALAAQGAQVIHPADGPALLTAIRAIKAHGPDDASRTALRDAAAELLARGATVQLIACTEFSLIADALPPGVTGIDTLDVLVAEIVRFARGSG
jgi:aspartate racemase